MARGWLQRQPNLGHTVEFGCGTRFEMATIEPSRRNLSPRHKP
jgi:hypothetical protein